MDRVPMLRNAPAAAGAPAIVSGSIEPVVKMRPDFKAIYDQLTDQSIDNMDRLQRYYYGLKSPGLIPFLDYFGGHFTNDTDSNRGVVGSFTPIRRGMDWSSDTGWHASGQITVNSITTTSGSKTISIGSAPATPLKVGMGINGTGIPNGSYLTSIAAGGGAGTYTFDNAEGLSATASATVNGTAGGFMTFFTPVAGVTKYQQDSCHIAFSMTDGASDAQASDPFIGRLPASGTVIDNLRIRIGSTGNDLYRMNAAATVTVSSPDLPPSGRYIFNRTSANRVEIWRNGEMIYSKDDAASSGLPSLITWGRSALFQKFGWKASGLGAGLTADLCRAYDRVLNAI